MFNVLHFDVWHVGQHWLVKREKIGRGTMTGLPSSMETIRRHASCFWLWSDHRKLHLNCYNFTFPHFGQRWVDTKSHEGVMTSLASSMSDQRLMPRTTGKGLVGPLDLPKTQMRFHVFGDSCYGGDGDHGVREAWSKPKGPKNTPPKKYHCRFMFQMLSWV